MPDAQGRGQTLEQEQFFQRGMRRADKADLLRAFTALHVLQGMRDIIERSSPVGFNPFAVLLDHRPGQAVLAVEPFIREAVTVGEPTFVELLVFQRQHAQHAMILDLHHQIAAQTVMRRH